MNFNIKKRITSVIVLIIVLSSILIPQKLFTDTLKNAAVVVRVGGDKVPPEKINTLVAQPRLVTGFYAGEENGGWIDLSWISPKDASVTGVHPDEPVFSYLVKYGYSLGYDTSTYNGLMQWYDDAQKVFSNHIWYDPVQARGQTFELYPYSFGIPSPEEKYNLGFGTIDKLIITGLQKGEKIYVSVASRDRYYNLSTPTITETYVPAGITPPSAVTDLVANYLGSGVVQLTWTSPGNDGVLYNIPDGKYFISYATSSPTTFDFKPQNINLYWPSAKTVSITTSTAKFVPQAYNITGLTLLEDTTNVGYYFLLWTSDEWYNKNNWSSASNIARYGLVTPNYVRNISLTSLASAEVSTGTYVKISWTNPSEEDIPLSGVRIYYSTRTYTTEENYVTYLTTIPNANCEIERPIQLIPRLTYYFVILSYNSMGSRPLNSEVILKPYIWEDIIAPDPVINLTGTDFASQENGTYINLTWTLPNPNLYQNKDYYLDGRIEVEYSTNSNLVTKNTKIVSATSVTTNITGLIPYTTYYVRVITSDGGNNKSTTTLINVYTRFDSYAPAKPQVLGSTVCASSNENIGSYVKFELKNPSDVDLKEVRMYYNTTGFGNSGNYILTTSSVPGLVYEQLSLYQLIPRVTYYFTFVSVDETNLQSTWETREVFIDKDILSPTTAQNVIIFADANEGYGTYVSVSFDNLNMTQYRNIDFSNFEIYLSSKNSVPYLDSEAKILTTTNNTAIFSHLTTHVTYYVSIHTVDFVGNKSTTTIYSVYAYKDIIAPSNPMVIISSYTVSLNPEDGVMLKVKVYYPSDLDLTNSIIKISDKQNFSTIISSRTSVATPNNNEEFVFRRLDCDTTYYLKVEVYDWSLNSSFSVIKVSIPSPETDSTIPLPPVSVKVEIKGNKIQFIWDRVEYHYNKTSYELEFLNYGTRKLSAVMVPKSLEIESFNGINNLGSLKPTTFELYKYKIYYTQDIFSYTVEEPQWELVAQLIPTTTFYQTVYKTGYYKIISYDITGNQSESLIVDTNLNYYIYEKSNLGYVYTKFSPSESQKLVNNKKYHMLEKFDSDIQGRVLESFIPSLGVLEKQDYKILYSPTYKSEYENIVGIQYKVSNDGMVRFSLPKDLQKGSNLKSIEIKEENLENSVAFFVYDGKDYIRTKTYFDKAQKLIYFKTTYLTKTQLRAVSLSNEFNFIGCKPKIITPSTSNGENDIALFEFDNPRFSEVVISIYDINSIKVNEIVTRESSLGIGNFVGWDGKDFDGKYVKPGVYIYQIECEGKKFKGNIIVAR